MVHTQGSEVFQLIDKALNDRSGRPEASPSKKYKELPYDSLSLLGMMSLEYQ